MINRRIAPRAMFSRFSSAPDRRPLLFPLRTSTRRGAGTPTCSGFVQSQQRPPYAGPSLRIVFLDLDGFELELIQAKGSLSFDAIRRRFPAVDDRAQVRGFGKLAFEVRDARETASRFKQQGVTFVRDASAETGAARRWFIVEDRDGNWLQFVEPRVPAKGM